MEICDDENNVDLDGCNNDCTITPGFTCVEDFSQRSRCSPICGNGVLDSNEDCDDYNLQSDDGCSACKVDSSYNCFYETDWSVCYKWPTAEITFISDINVISITFDKPMKQISLDSSLFTIEITKPNG